MIRCACLVFALVLVTVPALANIPAPDLCVLANAAGSDGAVAYVLPNGAGNALTNARLGGAVVDATLTLTVVNSLGDPIANYPAEDIWLVSADGGLAVCDLAHPDGPTDANGQTSWVQSLFAGGNSRGEDAAAVIAGDVVPTTAPVYFVSADINGDLNVDLSDVVAFTQALGTYSANADFNDDGVVNLTDVTNMTQAIGSVCP
jgi:hypothetical protein